MQYLTQKEAVDGLMRASLRCLYELTDDCENPYLCEMSATCPRAAKFQRKLRGYSLSALDGTLLYCNQWVAPLMGIPRNRLMQRNALSFYANPIDREILIRELQRYDHLKDYRVNMVHGTGAVIEYSMDLGLSVRRGERVIEVIFNPGERPVREWREVRMRMIE